MVAQPAGSGRNRRKASSPRRNGSSAQKLRQRREDRNAAREKVYRQRRILVICLLALGVVALVFAIFAGTSGATRTAVPIDPNNAGPDTVLAQAAGIDIVTPVRPNNLTGIGYHSDGGSLVEMAPRGRNLSSNALVGLFAGGSTPENIQYHVMDPEGRAGFRTGAMDIGAEAGTTVYAPVTGTVTAIRPDPMVQGASIVEIKSSANPRLLVSISLVQDVNQGVGPDKPITAGKTEIGNVADSAKVLTPQLSKFTGDTGNHVTVTTTRVG